MYVVQDTFVTGSEHVYFQGCEGVATLGRLGMSHAPSQVVRLGLLKNIYLVVLPNIKIW